MNAMDLFIEQKICQEIDCLTMQLLSIIDENQEKLASYGEQDKRIIQNAIFNLIININQPTTISPLATQNYPRYAEQSRKYFNKVIRFLNEFKPEKLYR